MDTPDIFFTSTSTAYLHSPTTIETPLLIDPQFIEATLDLPFEHTPSFGFLSFSHAYFDHSFVFNPVITNNFESLDGQLIPMTNLITGVSSSFEPSGIYSDLDLNQNNINLQELAYGNRIESIASTSPSNALSMIGPLDESTIIAPNQNNEMTFPVPHTTPDFVLSSSPSQVKLPGPEPALTWSPCNSNTGPSCPRISNTPKISNRNFDDIEKRIIHYSPPKTSPKGNPNSRKVKSKSSYKVTYDCPECEYWSDRAGNIKRHVENHKPNHKGQTCSKCSKSFSSGFNLKRHRTSSKACNSNNLK
ncbi:hypothetical protein F4703DRAFT_1224867 [Phycomyces blakesleeanus]